jgi:hypothetical protein
MRFPLNSTAPQHTPHFGGARVITYLALADPKGVSNPLQYHIGDPFREALNVNLHRPQERPIAGIPASAQILPIVGLKPHNKGYMVVTGQAKRLTPAEKHALAMRSAPYVLRSGVEQTVIPNNGVNEAYTRSRIAQQQPVEPNP